MNIDDIATDDLIQIVDDPGMVITSVDSVWSDSISWSANGSETTFYMKNIVIEELNCTENQFLTIKDHKMVCVTLPNIQPIIKEVPMWAVSNILFVAIIAAAVYKLMPKLTIKNFCKVVFRAAWRFIIRPFKKKERTIADEWSKAEFETREG